MTVLFIELEVSLDAAQPQNLALDNHNTNHAWRQFLKLG